MDTVIITGAGGEPALSIARRLCSTGLRVYALAGTHPVDALSEEEFFQVFCDLTSPAAVSDAVQQILEKEKHIVGLIIAGQHLADERFESIPAEEIPITLNAQVVSPLCAVRVALPKLIAARGHVIVVSPGTGTGVGRALNSVADAATRAFAGTLFAELRDTGVKACHILLQNNEGAPDPAARFTTAPQSRVHADIVADAVETVFKLRENNALTQMILRPQATRETPHIPVSSEPKIRALQGIQLPPPKNFPPEGELIPTPPYRRPEYASKKQSTEKQADEDEHLSDDFVDPELRYLVKENQPKPQRHDNRGDRPPKPDEQNRQGNPEGGRNRRNRRNRRNKNRNPDGAIRINAPQLTLENRQENQPHSKNTPPPRQISEKPEVQPTQPMKTSKSENQPESKSEPTSENREQCPGEKESDKSEPKMPSPKRSPRTPKKLGERKPRAPRKRKADGNEPAENTKGTSTK